MKPGPKHDFPVRACDEYREAEGGPFAEHCRGMYSVWLNFSVTIEFIPAFERPSPWPPLDVLPDAGDAVDAQRIRLETALYGSQYVVTPDPERAGETERVMIPTPAVPELQIDAEVRPLALFYVTPGSFARCAAELAALSEEQSWSVHAARPISSLAGHETARVLLDRILPSGHLSPYAMEILGRV